VRNSLRLRSRNCSRNSSHPNPSHYGTEPWVMISNPAILERCARLVECTDEGGTWVEWAPRDGLSLIQAVEVCAWCATRNVGRTNPRRWFEAFHECMIDAGFEYVAFRGQTLFAPPPPYPIDPGWTAVH
jgi:hypothetical protein